MSQLAVHAAKLPDQIAELVVQGIPDDDRLWVPQAPNVWFRPLMFDTVNGQWVNLLRVRRAGVLSRHRHPAPVYGYVLKGSWHYLEHHWIATEGSFIFEPPGDLHTLVVDDADEMITLFHVCGALIYIDEGGQQVGFDDVHTKIAMCREHYRQVGVDDRLLTALIR